MARRRTAASQERMKIISQLAKHSKKDDDFGRNDDDWDVYKVIRKVLRALVDFEMRVISLGNLVLQ